MNPGLASRHIAWLRMSGSAQVEAPRQVGQGRRERTDQAGKLWSFPCPGVSPPAQPVDPGQEPLMELGEHAGCA